jgi:hypothetical protein
VQSLLEIGDWGAGGAWRRRDSDATRSGNPGPGPLKVSNFHDLACRRRWLKRRSEWLVRG